MRIGRPTHTTVIAYVALFAALSGSAIAISRNSVKGKHIAKNAVRAKQIATNAVGTAEIANGAVTNPKLASNAVTDTKLATGAITNAKLAASAVDAGKILDNSLTDDELADSAQFNGAAADGDLDGTYPNPTLEASSVAAAEVSNGTLGTAEFSSTIPAVRVTNSADQSFAPLGFETVAFNQTRYETVSSMHSDTTNNSRLVAPVDGIYLVAASTRWESDPDGIRQLALEGEINDVTTSLGSSDTQSTGLSNQSVSSLVQLSAGDYVEVNVRHDNSVALDLDKSNQSSPEFMMTWLAPGP